MSPADPQNPYSAPKADLNEAPDLSADEDEEVESDENELWEDHVVSLWVGDFPSYEVAQRYFTERFEGDNTPISEFAADFGMRGYRTDCLDIHCDDAPLPIAELLSRCAYTEHFASAAAEAARREGIETATFLVALYHHDWHKANWFCTQGPFLRFLGVYPCGTLTGVPWLDRITARTDYPADAFLEVLEVVKALAAKANGQPIQPKTLCQGVYEHFVAKFSGQACQKLEKLSILSSENLADVIGGLMAEQVAPGLKDFLPEELHGEFTLDDWFPPAEG